jgi:hypothetical protein
MKGQDVDGVFFLKEENCPHLREIGNFRTACAVYGRNQKLQIGFDSICISAESMAQAALLPECCPYARRIPDYLCRVIGYPANTYKEE